MNINLNCIKENVYFDTNSDRNENQILKSNVSQAEIKATVKKTTSQIDSLLFFLSADAISGKVMAETIRGFSSDKQTLFADVFTHILKVDPSLGSAAIYNVTLTFCEAAHKVYPKGLPSFTCILPGKTNQHLVYFAKDPELLSVLLKWVKKTDIMHVPALETLINEIKAFLEKDAELRPAIIKLIESVASSKNSENTIGKLSVLLQSLPCYRNQLLFLGELSPQFFVHLLTLLPVDKAHMEQFFGEIRSRIDLTKFPDLPQTWSRVKAVCQKIFEIRSCLRFMGGAKAVLVMSWVRWMSGVSREVRNDHFLLTTPFYATIRIAVNQLSSQSVATIHAFVAFSKRYPQLTMAFFDAYKLQPFSLDRFFAFFKDSSFPVFIHVLSDANLIELKLLQELLHLSDADLKTFANFVIKNRAFLLLPHLPRLIRINQLKQAIHFLTENPSEIERFCIALDLEEVADTHHIELFLTLYQTEPKLALTAFRFAARFPEAFVILLNNQPLIQDIATLIESRAFPSHLISKSQFIDQIMGLISVSKTSLVRDILDLFSKSEEQIPRAYISNILDLAAAGNISLVVEILARIKAEPPKFTPITLEILRKGRSTHVKYIKYLLTVERESPTCSIAQNLLKKMEQEKAPFSPYLERLVEAYGFRKEFRPLVQHGLDAYDCQQPDAQFFRKLIVNREYSLACHGLSSKPYFSIIIKAQEQFEVAKVMLHAAKLMEVGKVPEEEIAQFLTFVQGVPKEHATAILGPLLYFLSGNLAILLTEFKKRKSDLDFAYFIAGVGGRLFKSFEEEYKSYCRHVDTLLSDSSLRAKAKGIWFSRKLAHLVILKSGFLNREMLLLFCAYKEKLVPEYMREHVNKRVRFLLDSPHLHYLLVIPSPKNQEVKDELCKFLGISADQFCWEHSANLLLSSLFCLPRQANGEGTCFVKAAAQVILEDAESYLQDQVQLFAFGALSRGSGDERKAYAANAVLSVENGVVVEHPLLKMWEGSIASMSEESMTERSNIILNLFAQKFFSLVKKESLKPAAEAVNASLKSLFLKQTRWVYESALPLAQDRGGWILYRVSNQEGTPFTSADFNFLFQEAVKASCSSRGDSDWQELVASMQSYLLSAEWTADIRSNDPQFSSWEVYEGGNADHIVTVYYDKPCIIEHRISVKNEELIYPQVKAVFEGLSDRHKGQKLLCETDGHNFIFTPYHLNLESKAVPAEDVSASKVVGQEQEAHRDRMIACAAKVLNLKPAQQITLFQHLTSVKTSDPIKAVLLTASLHLGSLFDSCIATLRAEILNDLRMSKMRSELSKPLQQQQLPLTFADTNWLDSFEKRVEFYFWEHSYLGFKSPLPFTFRIEARLHKYFFISAVGD